MVEAFTAAPLPVCKGVYSLSVCLWIIRPAKDIIDGYVVVIRKTNQNPCGNIDIAALVIAVNTLRTAKDFAHFLLREVMVLSQIAKPSIHIVPPFILVGSVYLSEISAIDS